jgi:rubrerythrin
MPLPSLEKITPVFDIVIPSTGQIAKFRPFLVKEEKLLLMALQENTEQEMLNAICQVINQCAMTPIKVNTLAIFDLQYIFLKIRTRSVGAISELSYRCQNKVYIPVEEAKKRSAKLSNRRQLPDGSITYEGTPDEGDSVIATCDNVVTFSLNLDEIEVKKNPAHKKTILLTDDLGITMKYPDVEMARRVNKLSAQPEKESISEAIEGIAYCVESVYDDTNVYTSFSIKEVTEFLEQLTQNQFTKIQEFFETMPKLAHDLPFRCSKCGYSENIHLEGLPAFFE